MFVDQEDGTTSLTIGHITKLVSGCRRHPQHSRSLLCLPSLAKIGAHFPLPSSVHPPQCPLSTSAPAIGKPPSEPVGLGIHDTAAPWLDKSLPQDSRAASLRSPRWENQPFQGCFSFSLNLTVKGDPCVQMERQTKPSGDAWAAKSL